MDAQGSRRQTAVLAAVMLGVFLAAVDGTVVTTAMPTAVRSLGGLNIYAWVFAAYMLTTAVSMPLWGKLADIRGSRGLFLLGVVIFVAGSALCGAAGTMLQLVAYRSLQGVGAGAMYAVPFTVVGLAFPPDRRARVLGVVAATWGIASIIGPLLGSAIVYLIGWRWVFYVNVPVGAVALWLAAQHVPAAAEAGGGHQVDWLGAALVACGVAGLLAALQLWASSAAAAQVTGLAALLALAAFVWVEGRSAEPILAPFLFRRRLFAIANGIAFASSFAVFGVLDYLPLLVPPGVSPATGAAILVFPSSVAWSVGSFSTGRVVRRIGVRPAVFTGMTLMTAGMLLFLWATGAAAGIWATAAAAIPIGLGMGALTPSLLSAVQNALRLDQMGMGTASQQFLRQLGGTLGVSALQLAFVARLAAAPPEVRQGAAQLLLTGGAGLSAPAFLALATALRQAFLLPLAATLIGLALCWGIPRGTR